MKQTSAIIVFGRVPTPGTVKTRLGRTIGMKKAAELYRQLLHYTLKIAQKANAQAFFFLPKGQSVSEADYPLSEVLLREQCGVDLGERMFQAFQTLEEEGFEKILLIGSDCPYLSPRHFGEYLELLDTSELTFGPASDGGYYLVGQKVPVHNVFDGIEWSTEKVWEQTSLLLKQKGLQFSRGEELEDLDDIHSLKHYQSLFKAGNCPCKLDIDGIRELDT